MASKKYLLVLATFIAVLGFTKVEAQNSGVYNLTSYDYTDSSLIPEKRMDQQNDFMNNRNLFPAKPRNQWEVGVSVGGLNVSGDVRSKSIFNQNDGIMNTVGFGLSVRKAWGYVISTRLNYIHGTASGYNYERAIGYSLPTNGGNDNPWNNTKSGLDYNGGAVNYNYCTQIRHLSLDVVAALNNVKYHKGTNKVAFHVAGGIGGLLYRSMTNAENATGGSYQADMTRIANDISATYTANNNNEFKARKDWNDQLLDMFDDTYETRSERHTNRGWFGDETSAEGAYTFRPVVNAGMGVQFRLGKRVSLQLEDKVIFTMDDLVDGQRWQERTAMTRDFDNINYLSLGLNVNLGGNSVAPLWWVNPQDFLYNAVANVKAPNNKCDADTDGDGVSDCYDRCGDTPGGVAVDTHGCPLDTDGDGVADYKDKQLITPTECQPSDADGIGKCPCPDGCGKVDAPGCGSIGNGSIMFSGGSRSLGSAGQNDLNNLANQMRSNPNCSVVVIGNGSGSKVAQQRSWDRVNAVINYMVDRNGIDRGRFIFQYGAMGNDNTVDYRSAGEGESGPSNTPPPFPNLKRN